jgi:RNA polymerase-binding protein DksA
VARKSKSASEKKRGTAKTKKSHLSAADLKRFQQMLLSKRQEIIGNVNEMKNEALNKSRLDASGDLSSMPIHMADIGTDNYDQEFALGLMDSERKLLREIDDALQRIENRTYGICEGTGKPIRKARLEAQPWARYSVEYAQMLEQGLVGEQSQ